MFINYNCFGIRADPRPLRAHPAENPAFPAQHPYYTTFCTRALYTYNVLYQCVVKLYRDQEGTID